MQFFAQMKTVTLLCLVLGSAVTACLPTVVIIDRASVIEEESAGNWPDLERELGLMQARMVPDLDLKEKEKDASALSLLPTGENTNQKDKEKVQEVQP